MTPCQEELRLKSEDLARTERQYLDALAKVDLLNTQISRSEMRNFGTDRLMYCRGQDKIRRLEVAQESYVQRIEDHIATIDKLKKTLDAAFGHSRVCLCIAVTSSHGHRTWSR